MLPMGVPMLPFDSKAKDLAKKSQDADAIAEQLLKVLPRRSMADWMVGYNVKCRYLGKK